MQFKDQMEGYRKLQAIAISSIITLTNGFVIAKTSLGDVKVSDQEAKNLLAAMKKDGRFDSKSGIFQKLTPKSEIELELHKLENEKIRKYYDDEKKFNDISKQ